MHFKSSEHAFRWWKFLGILWVVSLQMFQAVTTNFPFKPKVYRARTFKGILLFTKLPYKIEEYPI